MPSFSHKPSFVTRATICHWTTFVVFHSGATIRCWGKSFPSCHNYHSPSVSDEPVTGTNRSNKNRFFSATTITSTQLITARKTSRVTSLAAFEAEMTWCGTLFKTQWRQKRRQVVAPRDSALKVGYNSSTSELPSKQSFYSFVDHQSLSWSSTPGDEQSEHVKQLS